MHLKAQLPIFVPDEFFGEMDKWSKAALMDMVWDLSMRCSGADSLANERIMTEVRNTASIILRYRKQEKRHA